MDYLLRQRYPPINMGLYYEEENESKYYLKD